MLCAVGRSKSLPTSSPNASARASAFALSASSFVGAGHACISGVMAFTTSIAVKAPSPQISRMMVSAADAADASSSPTSPARINSVQLTGVPISPAAYSIDQPTKFHQVLNRVLASAVWGGSGLQQSEAYRARARSSVGWPASRLVGPHAQTPDSLGLDGLRSAPASASG